MEKIPEKIRLKVREYLLNLIKEYTMTNRTFYYYTNNEMEKTANEIETHLFISANGYLEKYNLLVRNYVTRFKSEISIIKWTRQKNMTHS